MAHYRRYDPIDVLRFIAQYQAEHHGVAPTIREIMVALNISSKSVVNHILNGLEAQGYIGTMPKQARALWLTTAGRGLVPCVDWPEAP